MRSTTCDDSSTPEDGRPRRHHDPFGPGSGAGFGPGFGHRGGPGFGRRGDAEHEGFGRGRGRGQRAPRGDVRAAMLLLLGESPMHGYQLMQRIAELSEGLWRPSPGTVYPVLAQLEDEGLVEVTREQGRKLATLTPEGRAYLTEHAEEIGDPYRVLKEESVNRVDLRVPVAELISAARQLVRSGSTAQQEAARTVLREARRSLYLILADDAPAPAATGDTEGTGATESPTDSAE